MAEKPQAVDNSPERRPVLVSPHSSTSELSASGSTNLQPFSVGRVSSSNNLSSITVPVRLDVLYFLINSAAKGSQCVLPPSSIHGGHSSASQCIASHCSCHLTCHSMPGCATVQPGEAPQCGRGCGGYGRLSVGVTESQNHGRCWNGRDQQNDGRNFSGTNQPSVSGNWREAAPSSAMGWKENQRGEGRGRGNRDNWHGRRQNFGRDWGDQRPNAADSAPWKSPSQDWRKEGSSFGSNYSNRKRAQETCGWQTSGDAPNAKRHWNDAGQKPKDDLRSGWPKSRGMEDAYKAGRKAADDGLARTAVPKAEEDWEADYKQEQAVPTDPRTVFRSSHPEAQADFSKAGEGWKEESAPTADLPKPRPAASPLPESASNDQEATTAAEKQPAASRVEWSKNGGFVSYLKQLYSDVPAKSSSEESADLVIDTDVELSKPEEEEQSLENVAGGGSKSWE